MQHPPALSITEGFTAEELVALAERVWPRGYDVGGAADALSRSLNLGARDGARLVGSVRLLTDGYFFSCVSEILVDPDYQKRGIGRRLMNALLERAPRGKDFLGAQPQSVGFFERLGAEPGPVGMVLRRRDVGSEQLGGRS